MPRRRLQTRGLQSLSSKHNNCQPSHLVIGVLVTFVLVFLVLLEPLDSSTYQSLMVSLPSEVDTLRSYSAVSSSSDSRYLLSTESSLPFPVPIPRDLHLDKLLPRLISLFRQSSNRPLGRLVNLGAGVRDEDPTFPLLDTGKWEALLADGDENQGLSMKERFPNPKIHTKVAYITANSIASLLEQHGFDHDIDLLKIDIDSFDCQVMGSLLQTVRPSIIVMEVNVKFPATVRFAFLPNAQEQYSFDSEQRGHVYGCSLAYQVHDLMRPQGYEILYLDANNAVYFDKQNAPAGLKDYAPLSLTEIYNRGYWNMPDRTSAFSFNNELEIWQRYKADQILAHLQKTPLLSHGHHHLVIGDLVQGAWKQPALQRGCFDPDSGALKEC